jgi:hypothetical protein
LLVGLVSGCGGRTLLDDIDLVDAGASSLPADMSTSNPMIDATRTLGAPDPHDFTTSGPHSAFFSDAGIVVRVSGLGPAPTAAGTLRLHAAVPGPEASGSGSLLLAVDPSGNVVIAGATRDPAVAGTSQFAEGHTAEAFVAKLSPEGVALWARPLASAGQPSGLGVDAKGEIVVVASDRSGTNPIGIGFVTSSLYFAKIATNGALLFDEHVDFGQATVDPSGLAVASDGTFYVAGSLQPGFASQKPLLERYDSAGNRLWSNVYSAKRQGHAAAVAAAPNGDALMTGDFDESVDVGSGQLTSTAHSSQFSTPNGFLGRYSSSGDCDFGSRFGGPTFDVGTAVTASPSNDILLGGAFTGPGVIGGEQVSSREAAFVAKLDPSGIARWVSVLEGRGNVTRRIAANALGEVYSVGQFGGPVYLRKLDAVGGTITNRKALSGTTNTTDVAMGKDGSAWITGTFDTTVDLGQGPIVGGPASYVAKLAP